MIDYGDSVFAHERLRRRHRQRDNSNSVFPPAAESLRDVPAKDKPLVMIVDDSPALIEVLSEILHYMGCAVISAHDGRDGLKLYKENQDTVALVILDMNMPIMKGEEALQGLRQINPDVPVIVSSSISEAEARRRCERYGQDLPDFLAKPYELNQARHLIRSLLRQVEA